MNRRIAIRAAVLSMIAGSLLTGAASADPWSYEQNFNGGSSLTGWSHTQTEISPSGTQTFLGQFDNDTVSLSLSNIPAHTQLQVSFDLYVIGTWDGNDYPGPDRWSFGVQGEQPAIDTTFAVSKPTGYYQQAWPMNYQETGSSFPHRYGAKENNTLGYIWKGWAVDAIQEINVTLEHSDAEVTLDFSAWGLQGIGDESWGIDNVVVTAVPAPGALAMFGLGGLVATRRRR
ncbi:MAG: PEP-CTERM sorting domain-containing protein [Phycisphaeraceae bacterium]|nr:PEP-CTERM sorting domain-containing protein [Phycisphaerales bacterium]MCB9858814.1 PEP-CTERM sorting domain-containing protein [Phycisphaeraceae bacterium]